MNKHVRNRRVSLVAALLVSVGILVLPGSMRPAAAQVSTGQIVARSGTDILTSQDLQDLLFLDGTVLETPLSASEQKEARDNIVEQFHRDPAAFAKSMVAARKYVSLVRSGSPSDRMQISTLLWNGWRAAAPSNPIAARWVALVRRHNPPIAEDGGLVVTGRQLAAMFTADDWVAHTAGLPTSTTESRAAFARALPGKFASLPLAQKQELARADLRWSMLFDPILDHSDLRAKAIRLVHQNVHGPGDVATEARSLEDDGARFHVAMQQFFQQMAEIGGVGTKGQMNANAINMASRKFMGEGH